MRKGYATVSALGLALCLVTANVVAAPADPGPFLGKWGIMLENTGTTFEACWMHFFEQNGKLDARMLWRWGSVTPVKSVRIARNEIRWVRPEYWEAKDKYVDTTYRAKIENGKLVGQVKMPDGKVYQFSGVRLIDKFDISGAWKVRVYYRLPPHPAFWERQLTLEQQGDLVKGVYVTGADFENIANAKLAGNRLTFSGSLDAESDGDVTYNIVFEGDQAKGTMTGGGFAQPLEVLARRPRKQGKTIALFNGRDLSGWHSRDPKITKPKWIVQSAYLQPLKGATDLVSDRKFGDFNLHVEYYFPQQNGNSGVYLRGRYEVQLLEDYGKGVDVHSCGGIYSRIAPTKNASKPMRELQSLDVMLIDRYVTVTLNGTVVVDNKYIEGITGGALDVNQGSPGPIVLQAHGENVLFKKVTITPLLK